MRYKSDPAVGLDWQAEVQPSYPMALSMHAMVEAIQGRGTASPDFTRALEIERLQEAIRLRVPSADGSQYRILIEERTG